MSRKQKITFEQAEEIRYAAKGGKVSRKELGERYGVHPTMVGEIIHYQYHRPEGMPAPERASGRGKRRPVYRKEGIGPRRLCLCGCGNPVTSLKAQWLTGHQQRTEKARKTFAENNPGWTDAEFIKVTLENCEERHLGAETPCMIWKGEYNKTTGYCATTRKGRQTTRHRLVYQALWGVSLPRKMQVDHMCAHQGGTGGKLHRRCMNPEHLQAVSGTENVRLSNSRMDADKVRELRRLRDEDPKRWTFKELGKRFGISGSNANHIYVRERWANVY